MDILDLIFPKRCVGCRKAGSYICRSCQKTIELQIQRCPACDKSAIDGKTHARCLTRYGLDGLTTVFRYDGVVKKTIKSIKYRFVYDMATVFINLIPQEIYQRISLLPQDMVIYPIPLHRDRLRWRGFNQAERLGQIVAKRLHKQMIDGLLTRQSKRTPQADISRRVDRIKNAQGLFVLSPRFPEFRAFNSGNLLVKLSILLIDDVWTTGATMKEATRILKKGGVTFVWGMTMAR